MSNNSVYLKTRNYKEEEKNLVLSLTDGFFSSFKSLIVNNSWGPLVVLGEYLTLRILIILR